MEFLKEKETDVDNLNTYSICLTISVSLFFSHSLSFSRFLSKEWIFLFQFVVVKLFIRLSDLNVCRNDCPNFLLGNSTDLYGKRKNKLDKQNNRLDRKYR